MPEMVGEIFPAGCGDFLADFMLFNAFDTCYDQSVCGGVRGILRIIFIKGITWRRVSAAVGFRAVVGDLCGE